ncbi:MAG: hypothetical protein KDJ35_02730 [Alphaproteobacteria bacterium]|nr:hypothetical protein [Alphaproteobacteria bacterium]
MDAQEKDKIRLSDRILSALELTIQQEDVAIADVLLKALDMSMTRNTGGNEFIERRDYPPEIEAAIDKLHDLRTKNSAA